MPRGKKKGSENRDPLEARLDRATKEQLHLITDRTISAIEKWNEDGIPRNPDKTYDLRVAIPWYIENKVRKTIPADEKSQKEKKLEIEIEYKQAQIDKIRENMVDRSLHEQILCSRASSLRQFIEQSMSLNAVHFVNLNLDVARNKLYNLGREMIAAYLGYFEKAGKVDNSHKI